LTVWRPFFPYSFCITWIYFSVHHCKALFSIWANDVNVSILNLLWEQLTFSEVIASDHLWLSSDLGLNLQNAKFLCCHSYE
jgi:hypothetical protein